MGGGGGGGGGERALFYENSKSCEELFAANSLHICFQ